MQIDTGDCLDIPTRPIVRVWVRMQCVLIRPIHPNLYQRSVQKMTPLSVRHCHCCIYALDARCLPICGARIIAINNSIRLGNLNVDIHAWMHIMNLCSKFRWILFSGHQTDTYLFSVEVLQRIQSSIAVDWNCTRCARWKWWSACRWCATRQPNKLLSHLPQSHIGERHG